MFRSFRNCFQAIRAWEDYQQRRKTWRVRAPAALGLPAGARSALDGQSGVLSPERGNELLRAFDLPLVRDALVQSAAQAARAARKIGFPVAMKLASPDFPHKTDLGLVELGVASAADAKKVYEALVRRARRANRKARIDGVQIQQMAGEGIELLVLLVGVTRDPILGPAVTVGMGGVFTEILADVAVRPLPLDRRDAREMLAGLRGAKLLRGARGKPASTCARSRN
jgi:acyl-CoA synthetase (NDP forming)